MNNLLVAHLNKEKFGIENLKEAGKTTFELVQDSTDLIKNWSWPKATNLIFKLAEYKSMLPVYRKAWLEITDLSPREAREFNEYAQGIIDLKNQKAEVVLEEGMDLIVDTYEWLKNTLELAGRWKDYTPKVLPAFQGSAAARKTTTRKAA